MKTHSFSFLCTLALLPPAVGSLCSASTPESSAPSVQQVTSPLPPVSFTPEMLQTMQNWMDTLRRLGSILNSGKDAEAIAAELEAMHDEAARHGAAVKKLRAWRREPALRLLGLDDKGMEEMALPMYECSQNGYMGSKRLEAVMNRLASALIPHPWQDYGDPEPLGLRPQQVVQEYLFIVHGVEQVLNSPLPEAAREEAMQQLVLRAFRLGELGSDDDIPAIRREMERRVDELNAAHQAALPLFEQAEKDASPRMKALLKAFGEQMDWVGANLVP